MYERRLTSSLSEALADTPVVIVIGPRQSGKSTLVNGLPGRRYVTLDDPLELQRAKTNPADFLDGYGTPVTIDEIQRAPELFLPLKQRVDRSRAPGGYLLTGSANVLTLPKVADSLAGRMEVLELLPLTQAELDGTGASNPIDRFFGSGPFGPGEWPEDGLEGRIVRGGFPEPAARPTLKRRQSWFQSYLRTLLERDVRDLAHIEGLSQVPRLLSLLASRTGEVLNVSSLARETGIAATTLTRYLDLLKALFLVDLVPAWSADVDVRLMKTPKAFLVDASLACNLGNLDEDSLSNPDRLGPMVRNFVANELRRTSGQSEARPWLMHLRTVRQKEVDFVLEAPDGRVVGVQCSLSTNPTPGEFEGLEYLAELAGPRFHRGVLLTRGREARPIGPKIASLPYSALWSNLG